MALYLGIKKNINMRLIEVLKCENEIVLFVNKLLAQLSSKRKTVSEDYLNIIIDSPNSQLLLLIDADDNYVGMIFIGEYNAPSGPKAWIEDVVIDNIYRGRGLGRTMLEMTLEYLRAKGIQNISLTTNPKRISANSLYKSLGFKLYETNVYKLNLKLSSAILNDEIQ